MPVLIDLRRRIRSVRSTRQLTRAMKLVAAAKVKKAQEQIFKSRPYAKKMIEVLSSLATRANPDEHPLLKIKGDQNIDLLVITADKGLCGAFNSNIIKQAVTFMEENKNKNVRLHLIGKKGYDFFRKRRYNIKSHQINIFRKITFKHAIDLSHNIIASYTEGNLDALYLLYNEYKSALQQNIIIEKLLPIERLKLPEKETAIDYIYEPEAYVIFDILLPHFIEIEIYHALLESSAAEHAARMAAMELATKNAEEMIDRLTLVMNKIRQASITKDIIEIVGAAEAL
ncbi:MAG: ATP synthase F1 subunit gamma [Candidatus Fischerbacteria bacterium RBG_13_37_8]|uniref:ATP synthase gamma chain n=1 Tax=Candidatus Fischerbacteria bacterium RBG_13_37_8 TaxID=1817863 RepID=A0A1F5VTF3_9BACT|nr:MAG: ATP synthase F1 subunit gamma [Candidatus Fischerbacteria bacterium RBG_13_37_8]